MSELNIINNYLTISPYTRPGRKLDSVRYLVVHWVANPR